jgi:hypothetical protein
LVVIWVQALDLVELGWTDRGPGGWTLEMIGTAVEPLAQILEPVELAREDWGARIRAQLEGRIVTASDTVSQAL